jgi:putative FmdB family regulatory protein
MYQHLPARVAGAGTLAYTLLPAPVTGGGKEGIMPTYEYRCSECGKQFSVTRTVSAHDKGRVACPKCGGRKVAQQFTRVFTKTSRKS